MGKYTSDDNRSMQLNDNNERYYSSRGIDQDDDYDEDGPPDYKWIEIECEACQHCIQWYTTGSWMPCLFPKKVKLKLN